MAIGCADGGPGPWGVVTDGEISQVSASHDGEIAALVRGTALRDPVVKLFDANGVEQWSRSLEGWGGSIGALGAGRVLVAHGLGVELHDREGVTPFPIPASSCEVDVHVDGRGHAYLMLLPDEGASFGGMPAERGRSYLVTIDPGGAIVGLEPMVSWSCPRIMAVSPSGDLLISEGGRIVLRRNGVSTTFTDDMRWQIPHDAVAALADDGSIAVASVARDAPLGGSDVRVRRFGPSFGPSGVEQWTRWVGGPGGDTVVGLAMNADGRVHVTGAALGVAGTFLDPTVEFGTLSAEIPESGSQTFLAAWEPNGQLAWGAAPGSAADDAATSIALAPDGSLIVGGWFVGAMELPGGTHMASATTDAPAGYVAHVVP